MIDARISGSAAFDLGELHKVGHFTTSCQITKRENDQKNFHACSIEKL